MSYEREIPRDLFNEGNFLKCCGQLYLNLETLGKEHLLIHEDQNEAFNIEQELSSGDLHLTNVFLKTDAGEKLILARPLNSRESYPLLALLNRISSEHEPMEIFKENGSFTVEFLNFIQKDD